MSYSGKPTGDGLFLQGRSTSTLQDTWDTPWMSYTSANKVATLKSPFKGAWRLTPYMYSSSGSGILQTWRPQSSTSTENAKNGENHSWNGYGRCGGDNSLCDFNTSSIGFYPYPQQGGGSWSHTVAKETSFCEVLL